MALFLLACVLAGPIRSSAEIYRPDVLPGEPILVRLARENTGEADLLAETGDADPEWLRVDLVRDGASRTIPLACTRRHTSRTPEPGVSDFSFSSGTLLYARRTDLSDAGFLVPSSLAPGGYTARISWAYACGPARKDGIPDYRAREEGTADLRVVVRPADPAGLAAAADDLAARVRDRSWRGRQDGGLALAAADALFSMSPQTARGAWRRLATEPERNTVNGVPHAFLPGFSMFATLARREDPVAVEILALLAANERAIEPGVWEGSDRYGYLKALRKLSESESPAVARAAQKALAVETAYPNP